MITLVKLPILGAFLLNRSQFKRCILKTYKKTEAHFGSSVFLFSDAFTV